MKLDLTKQHKNYFTAKTKPELVTIEPANFLSISGKGDPSGVEFTQRIQALYATAYTIKFTYKSLNKDFVVSKLEGLWWFDDKKYAGIRMTEAPKQIPRSEWEYRLLIRMPDFVSKKEVASAIEAVYTKKKIALAKHVEFYAMNEGKCIQILHIGPFSTEPESLEKIQAFSQERHLRKNGLHHEIYLSDFNRTAPEKLKTILREPVK